MALAALLPGNIRDIGLLDASRREGAFEVIADDKTGAVAVGQHDQPAGGCDATQQLELFLIVENAKAAALQHDRIHHLPHGIDVIAAFDEDRLLDADHLLTSFSAAAMESSASSICFCLSTALPLSAESVCAHSDAACRSQESGTRRAAFWIWRA